VSERDRARPPSCDLIRRRSASRAWSAQHNERISLWKADPATVGICVPMLGMQSWRVRVALGTVQALDERQSLNHFPRDGHSTVPGPVRSTARRWPW
jgi:hypothetical protein